jgi:hypothetical protein
MSRSARKANLEQAAFNKSELEVPYALVTWKQIEYGSVRMLAH